MNKNKLLHLCISIIIFIALKLILPINENIGLTNIGASVLALFISTIYVWMTVGCDWTSFLTIGLISLTGIATPAQVWQISLGNATTVLTILISILSYAVNATSIGQNIAIWFVTRKMTEKKPYVFFVLFMVANLLFSYVMDGIPTTIVFALIAKNIIKRLGYDHKDKFTKSLFLLVLWVSSIGMAATPIGHPIPIIIIGLIENAIGPVSYLKYMTVGIPYSILFCVIALLIIRFIIRPDCSKFVNYNVEGIRTNKPQVTKQGKTVVICYVFVILMWILPDVLNPLMPTIAGMIKDLGPAFPPLLAVFMLCVIHIEGKPCLDFKEAMKNVPWPAIIFLAAIMAFSTVMTFEASGINIFLRNLISPMAGKLSIQAIASIAMFLALISTNLMSNTVAASIIISTFVPVMLASSASFSMIGFGVMISLFANTSFMFPSGSAAVAIIQQDGYLTAKDKLKYGTLIVISSYILGMLLIWPIAKSI